MNKSILTLVALLCLFSCSKTQKTISEEKDVFNETQIKKSMIKALEWQEAHPIFAIHPTDWTNGAYYTGVARAHYTTKNMMYMAENHFMVVVRCLIYGTTCN